MAKVYSNNYQFTPHGKQLKLREELNDIRHQVVHLIDRGDWLKLLEKLGQFVAFNSLTLSVGKTDVTFEYSETATLYDSRFSFDDEEFKSFVAAVVPLSQRAVYARLTISMTTKREYDADAQWNGVVLPFDLFASSSLTS